MRQRQPKTKTTIPCIRCGVERIVLVGARKGTGMCRDCWVQLTKTERLAWAA